jgi:hypothetical protein
MLAELKKTALPASSIMARASDGSLSDAPTSHIRR